jgi:hypothetical protein
VSLDGRGSGQSDSVGCEPRHCASKDTLSEPDLAHVCKCVLGRQHWSKSKVDQVKTVMTYSMKSENKLEGASNFRAWKTRIDLILAKNKVLNIVKGKIVEPQFEEGKEKEPQNVAVMEKFKDNDINAMSIIVDSVKDHLIPYISHLDSSKKMYDALTTSY